MERRLVKAVGDADILPRRSRQMMSDALVITGDIERFKTSHDGRTNSGNPHRALRADALSKGSSIHIGLDAQTAFDQRTGRHEMRQPSRAAYPAGEL